MSSENWFARLNAGDQDAMEGLLNEYGAMMAYVVRGILTDPHEAEDCLAEVRAKLWEKAACYDGKKAGLSTWITALCRNAAYDRRRALARRASRAGALGPKARPGGGGAPCGTDRRPAPGAEHPEFSGPEALLPQVLLPPVHRPDGGGAWDHGAGHGGQALPHPQKAAKTAGR